MLKRTFDIIFSAAGLIILSPLFLLISLIIKIDSRGPIFYRQIRVGKDSEDFLLYKFRSMRLNSDKDGLLTVGGKDPRITKSGYYIRKYKLDELPQLINVLKGEMSFVGPRPEVRKYVDLYNENQKQVLKIKPGITDNASIIYRNENDLLKESSDPESLYINEIMPDKLKINLEYIDKNSFASDLKIIFKTIKSMFT
ncbi:MAG: UDP-glucose:undecaprenyl-phosphate glucose-1-phosphate transferase [Ignavibacteria bacterium]|nr:UDP-glucose:undecaprenyl-phosphate glucose-1-phosphate transferase [Ignavibacteria bacterium]